MKPIDVGDVRKVPNAAGFTKAQLQIEIFTNDKERARAADLPENAGADGERTQMSSDLARPELVRDLACLFGQMKRQLTAATSIHCRKGATNGAELGVVGKPLHLL